MFERFSQMSHKIIEHAKIEADNFYHNLMGPEHMLLGILHESECRAFRCLVEEGIDPAELRQCVKEFMAVGAPDKTKLVNFTSASKKVFELAIRACDELKDQEVGTLHFLIGMLEEGNNIAGEILSTAYELAADDVKKRHIFYYKEDDTPLLDSDLERIIPGMALDYSASSER
jgi:ATP-dependent Clp protease ATP-binding subunit ClpC